MEFVGKYRWWDAAAFRPAAALVGTVSAPTGATVVCAFGVALLLCPCLRALRRWIRRPH